MDGDHASIDDEIVAIIREVVAHAAQTDPEHRRFGARQHGDRWWPAISDARVAALERAIGVELPAETPPLRHAARRRRLRSVHGLRPLDHPVQVAARSARSIPPSATGARSTAA